MLADQDLVAVRGLLEPGGHVDGVAAGEPLPQRGVAGDHLAGVDAGPGLQPHAPALLQLLVQLLQRRAHVERGPHRSQRVVLARSRNPEDRHDRVADELLHGSSVAHQRLAHRAEVARDDLAQGLGVEPLAQARGVDEVAEHDRHDLAEALRLGRAGERHPADRAEMRPLGGLLTAIRARGHRQSLGWRLRPGRRRVRRHGRRAAACDRGQRARRAAERGRRRADRAVGRRPRGQARRRSRDLAPPRPGLARHRGRAEDRGPRVGERHLRQRRADRRHAHASHRRRRPGGPDRPDGDRRLGPDSAADPHDHPAGGQPGAGGHRRRRRGPPSDARRRVHDRARGERRGEAGGRRRAVAPPRARDARRLRPADHRGSRVGERDLRERRGRARAARAAGGRLGASRPDDAGGGGSRAAGARPPPPRPLLLPLPLHRRLPLRHRLRPRARLPLRPRRPLLRLPRRRPPPPRRR